MLTERLTAWRLRRAFERRVVALHAPYPIELYRSIVRQAKGKGLPIGRFTDPQSVAPATRIFFRHDIDYAGCVAGASALLDVNLKEQVPAAVFLRMDGEAYRPEEAINLVRTYKSNDITFGLHTSCYTHENYLSVLERERDTFLRTYGFEARTFTVHGLGDQHLQRRLAFTAYAAANLAELGFDHSDCTADLRPYHLVFQDCDIDPVNGKRAIYSEMETLPPLMRYGHNYLVLTHPCYWKL